MSNREIKFRAYYGGKMYHDVVVGGFPETLASHFWDTDAPQTKPAGYDEDKKLRQKDALKSGWLNLPEKAIVMQYTGLHDKNGVEIYEGDIVRSPSMPDSPIEHQRGAFNAVYADGSGDDWEAPLWRYTVEVLGNVYEHPYLLEVGGAS